MTIREKLLMEIAKNPNFEGNDATEKSLVAELKAEMGSNESSTLTTDGDINAAAETLAKTMTELVTKLVADKQDNTTEIKRDALQGDKSYFRSDEFATEVKEAAKAQNADISDEAKLTKFTNAYRLAEFVKALYRKNESRVRALAEANDTDGGALVPDAFRAELIQHLLTSESFRRYATVIPMDGKYLEIPKLTADVKVSWGTENKAIATTTADFGNMTLTPFRMNAVIRTSRELFDDSALSLMDILSKRFRDRVADEENKVFLTGNGTTQPKGINGETLRSVNAASALTPDHLTAAYYKLPEAYRANSRWLINSRTMAFLENKKDNNGAYLYPSLQGDIKTLKGRPVLVNDYVPSASIFLGDVSAYFIGDRQQMSMEVSTEEGNTWVKYQVSIRVIERIDGELSLSQAFVKITNTNIH